MIGSSMGGHVGDGGFALGGGFAGIRSRAGRCVRLLLCGWLAGGALAAAGADADGGAAQQAPLFHDVHFHLSNYAQRGISANRYFDIVGDRVGRVAMFGIPLQQKWDYFVSGDRAPDYYLLTDAALYYYSFVDAAIAMEYLSLSDERKARVDPMITGFNPTDMYAADHIRRVLLAFPGVFTGIGEFSVHKEFVSAKVAGHTASLRNPALDRIFETVAEIGLVAILHCDIDTVRQGPRPVHYDELLRLLAAHPDAAVIWAHTGLGRFIAPADRHLVLLDEMLGDPRYDHVTLDISWDEVARYVVRDASATAAWAELIEQHPTRFLFGTDSVAPADWDAYAATHTAYGPLWELLTAETRALVERGNYERVFDAAKSRVRAWEQSQTTAGTNTSPAPR
ncbi:MAG: amidohydrolase [Gammaproteobacteria bacterium]|nr:amidohydrolase [Gammaproteobacteria bacterium]